ncbi:hypothetical protein [Intrasporangium sp. DVR]|uniref:hypothetical protein n=1 Tax=Intrasporangium sp. DVR TaxID=3127867 RepID=UPI00313A6B5F
MSKHFGARVASTVAAITAFIILGATRAMAVVDPGLGEGSGSAPPVNGPAPAAPFEIFGMAWQPTVAMSVALVAVAGLAFSLQHRRHIAGQHA